MNVYELFHTVDVNIIKEYIEIIISKKNSPKAVKSYRLELSKDFDTLFQNILSAPVEEKDFEGNSLLIIKSNFLDSEFDTKWYSGYMIQDDNFDRRAFYPSLHFQDLRWGELLSLPLSRHGVVEDYLMAHFILPMFYFHGATLEQAEMNYATRSIKFITNVFKD